MAAQRSIINDGAGTHKSQEQIAAEAEAARLRRLIEEINNKIVRINQLKAQIASSTEALHNTRNSFANGGHSYNGISLGMTTGAACIAALNSASSALDAAYDIQKTKLNLLQNQYRRVCSML